MWRTGSYELASSALVRVALAVVLAIGAAAAVIVILAANDAPDTTQTYPIGFRRPCAGR
jgi:hypothetical protein